MTTLEGKKYDTGKAPSHLLPPEFLEAVCTILAFGAEKYGERNWEEGMLWSRLFSAAMRHMWAWWAGKQPSSINFAFGELDDETGFSHLWHAACCVMFLIVYEERKTGKDDRYSGTPARDTSNES